MSTVSFNELFNGVKFENFDKKFKTSADCKRVLSEIKWKNGFVCRFCGHTNYCVGKDDYSRRCTKCKKQESATANTVFHACKIDLIEAFKIAFVVCCNPEMAASEISRNFEKRHMTCLKFKNKILEYKNSANNN